MANTYSWTINKLDVYPEQDSLVNVVYNVHYTYTGTSSDTDDDGNAYTASMIGTKKIGAPDSDDYTAFDDLTKSDVVGWLEAEIDMDSFQSSVDNRISSLITPTTETKDVPW